METPREGGNFACTADSGCASTRRATWKRLQLFLRRRRPLERRIQDERASTSTGTLIVSANCSTRLLQADHRRSGGVASPKTTIISLKIRQRRRPLSTFEFASDLFIHETFGNAVRWVQRWRNEEERREWGSWGTTGAEARWPSAKQPSTTVVAGW